MKGNMVDWKMATIEMPKKFMNVQEAISTLYLHRHLFLQHPYNVKIENQQI